jgi:hypothetical protein
MHDLRTLILTLGAALLAGMAPIHADLLVKPHDVVVVCTEENPNPGMASMDVAQYFLMCQPVEGIEVVQSAQHYDGVEAFMKRVEIDLTPWHPTVALISHGCEEGSSDAQSRGLTYYHPTYLSQSVDNLKKIGVRTIVLGTANCVDSFYFKEAHDFKGSTIDATTWNQNLALFRDTDRQIAEKQGVAFADIYSQMMEVMPKVKAAYGENYAFGGEDAARSPASGQLVIAYAFLKALGCDGAIGTITVDLAANKAEGTPGQKIISAQNGTVEVESSRYPYCFNGPPEKADSTSGVIPFFPFNDELNRYLLVVNGMTSARAKVTWGTESREFTAVELQKGVNLAAAFAAHTPFDEPFHKVQTALWDQQQSQSLFTDSFFHKQPDLKLMAPTASSTIDEIAAAIIAQDRSKGATAAALVVPVRHTLKIEAIP